MQTFFSFLKWSRLKPLFSHFVCGLMIGTFFPLSADSRPPPPCHSTNPGEISADPMKDKESPIPLEFSDDFRRAEKMVEEGSFSEASEIYQSLSEKIEKAEEGHLHLDKKEWIPKLRFRQAEASYLSEDYSKAVFLLSKLSHDDDAPHSTLFLLALAHKKLVQDPQAIEALKAYLKTEQNDKIVFKDEALFELGSAEFRIGNIAFAQEHFQSISSNRYVYCIAQLYLSHIAIDQGNFEQANKILVALVPQLIPSDSLHGELAHLQGLLAFHDQDYSRATFFFEQALAAKSPFIPSTTADTLYLLGYSYLKMSSYVHLSDQEKRNSMDKAETTFQYLLENSRDEKVYLALGQTYLARGQLLKEEESFQKAEKLLSLPAIFTSSDAQTQALILRAEATNSYFARERLYRQLTQESHSQSTLYSQGWYLRGLNDFEEGVNLSLKNRQSEANKAYEKSIISFKKAYELFKESDKAKAGNAMKYQAQAFFEQKTNEAKLKSLAILEELNQQHQEIFMAMEAPDEVLYLQGLVAAELFETERDDKYNALTVQSLSSVQEMFPSGHFADSAMYLLGSFYYRQGDFQQAEEIFVQLGSLYPSSRYAGDAWFWASKSADNLNESLIKIKTFRQTVFEKYPNSLYAAEAYFCYYTLSEYLSGDPKALKHLQNIHIHYSKSPFLISAFYLTGLDQKRNRKNKEGKWTQRRNLFNAIDAFQNGESTFDLLYQNNEIAEKDLPYFAMLRYRSTLERALVNLSIAEESKGAKKQIYLEYTIEVFKNMMRDFEDPTHEIARQLQNGDSYPILYQECEFGLAQTYLKAHREPEAKKIFTQMKDHYDQAKITRGYFLARVWYEEALLMIQEKRFSLALDYLGKSEDASKGNILSSDQKLDIWIQQSYCYREMHQLDNAMLILSQIINEDIISSLRLKAMYLRAEIYEMQGRRELAIKQLEATSKKGGEWALKAKQKLETDYAFK